MCTRVCVCVSWPFFLFPVFSAHLFSVLCTHTQTDTTNGFKNRRRRTNTRSVPPGAFKIFITPHPAACRRAYVRLDLFVTSSPPPCSPSVPHIWFTLYARLFLFPIHTHTYPHGKNKYLGYICPSKWNVTFYNLRNSLVELIEYRV